MAWDDASAKPQAAASKRIDLAGVKLLTAPELEPASLGVALDEQEPPHCWAGAFLVLAPVIPVVEPAFLDLILRHRAVIVEILEHGDLDLVRLGRVVDPPELLNDPAVLEHVELFRGVGQHLLEARIIGELVVQPE